MGIEKDLLALFYHQLINQIIHFLLAHARPFYFVFWYWCQIEGQLVTRILRPLLVRDPIVLSKAPWIAQRHLHPPLSSWPGVEAHRMHTH